MLILSCDMKKCMTGNKHVVYAIAIAVFLFALLPVPVTKNVYRDETVEFGHTKLYRTLSPYIMCLNVSSVQLQGTAYNYNISYSIPSVLAYGSGNERYTDAIVTHYTVTGVNENTSRYSRYISHDITPRDDVARFTARCVVYNLTAVSAKVTFRVNVYSESDMLLHSVAVIDVIDNYSSYAFAIYAELNNYTSTTYTVNVEISVSGVFVVGRDNVKCCVTTFPGYYYKGVPIDTRSTNDTVKWIGTKIILSENSFETRKMQNIVSSEDYTSGIFGNIEGETVLYQSRYGVTHAEVSAFKSFIVNSSTTFTETPYAMAKVNRCNGATEIIMTDYNFSMYEVPLSYRYESIGNCHIIAVNFDYALVSFSVTHPVITTVTEILPWWATL